MKKFLKTIGIVILTLTVVLIVALSIYARDPYTALEEMNTELETIKDDSITITDTRKAIELTVDNPKSNVILVPGGLVTPDSYLYLAYGIAKDGHNVTIVKTWFNLAIVTPSLVANDAKGFIDEELTNTIIGHSLGGVVSSIVASENEGIDNVIMLGSYPIADLNDKTTFMISAEHDIMMDEEAYTDSLVYVNDDNIITDIEGANHGQFGWYGYQEGDGEAEIDTLTQQTLVINYIVEFIDETLTN